MMRSGGGGVRSSPDPVFKGVREGAVSQIVAKAGKPHHAYVPLRDGTTDMGVCETRAHTPGASIGGVGGGSPTSVMSSSGCSLANRSTNCPARWLVPRQCSKRLCEAPGNTKRETCALASFNIVPLPEQRQRTVVRGAQLLEVAQALELRGVDEFYAIGGHVHVAV